jgi:hypothetical protein
VQAGSIEADRPIHAALGLTGPMLPYTREKAAARSPLPAGFEWLPGTYASGEVYATCWQSGMDREWPYPHHEQWGATLPLAMRGAVMRANAALMKG